MKLTLLSALLKKFQKFEVTPRVTLGLKPLHPEHDKPEHDVYVNELCEALKNDAVRNIALTGSYGSGKSSILSQFASHEEKKNPIIQVSLATLGDDVEYSQSNKEEQSNLIQKEIVKQLLFREAPHNVPASKFKRISAPYKPHVLLFAILCAMIFTALIYYYLGPGVLYKLAGVGLVQVPVALSLLLVTFSLTAFALIWTHGKFTISKLTGGPVSLSTSNENNYFDQYLVRRYSS